jgi:hypothetical protein
MRINIYDYTYGFQEIKNHWDFDLRRPPRTSMSLTAGDLKNDLTTKFKKKNGKKTRELRFTP